MTDNLSSKGLIARLTKVRDGYTVPQADDPRDSPWNVLNEAAATLERVESENETLRLAICGGEDAPGYAVSLPLEMILGVLRDNYTSWRRAEAQVEALRTLLRQAFDSRAPDYAEQAHPGWYDRALAALSVPAEERRAAALSDLAAQDAEEIFGPTTALDVALQALADAGVDGVPPEALAAAIEAARVAAGWGRSSPSESSLRTPPEWYGQQTDESGSQPGAAAQTQIEALRKALEEVKWREDVLPSLPLRVREQIDAALAAPSFQSQSPRSSVQATTDGLPTGRGAPGDEAPHQSTAKAEAAPLNADFADELRERLLSLADDADLKRRHTHLNGEIRSFATIVKIAANVLGRPLAQAEARSANGGWQPIETAPKDGREVILRRGDRVGGSSWCIWPDTELAEGGEGWGVGCDGCHWDDEKSPTHWMPLPTPEADQ